MSDPKPTSKELEETIGPKVKAAGKKKKAIIKNAVKLEHLVVEYVPWDSIQPNTYNPNRQSDHDFELLVKSMESDGFTTPIVCNKDRQIVDGEHRWRAAEVLGYDEVPVVFVDMSIEQMRISTIRHNRAKGTHDLSLEAQVMRDLFRMGALAEAQDELLLDDVEVEKLVRDLSATEDPADYSDAVIPEGIFSAEERALIDTKPVLPVRAEIKDGDPLETSSATFQALEQMRQRERLIAAASSAQERQRIAKESLLYRVQLTFANEEAEVIRTILGNQPAEMLLKLCKEELNLG